ncbi:MAG: hypothetical protein C4518_11110 [Desulfobacteraceae bacterium]|nr:MAG: hypothetical protein C4518_11110 [Desulfobacteraceae bacterium]
MTIKVKSTVKEIMTQKGIQIQEISKKTGLPHVVILNACSDKIEFCGLNMLIKIASALDVSIKDLFEEILPAKKSAPGRKPSVSCDTSISAVTEQLLTIITKLSSTDKDRLLGKLNELKRTPGRITDTKNATKELIEMIMGMSLEQRCNILGDFIAMSGQTKRQYSRRDFFRPVPFTLKGRLYHGSTRNISTGGVFIEIKDARVQFSPGDNIKMNIEHPDTLQHLNRTGTIVRVAKDGIGVKFDVHL